MPHLERFLRQLTVYNIFNHLCYTFNFKIEYMIKKLVFAVAFLFVSFISVAQQLKSVSLRDTSVRIDSSLIFKRMFFANPLQDYHYFNQMGVMCRLEYKMQKAIKIPLCFRVGSLEECKKREAIPVTYP